MYIPDRYEPKGDAFSGGGMSDAIVCEDKHLERLVLVKQLQDGIDQTRLSDEIAALAKIRSKHVVQIFDVLSDEDLEVVGLVEEYLPGQDLNKILPMKDEETFLKTAYAIACGISDIHEQGLVHRDIKPTNMKFDGEGCLKIFDFGLSRPDDAKTTGTVGTLGYLAPELCVGEDEEVSFSQPVDVFAFGATALKMLRGNLPPDLRKVPPKLPCDAANFVSQPLKLPSAIADILNACLSADPNTRPKMTEIRDALAAHLLRNRHVATLVLEDKIFTLEATKPVVNIDAGSLGSMQVKYDGLQFVVGNVSGDVSINNLAVTTGQVLPGSCVIILGNSNLGWNRKYVTVDLSHPEVVL